MKVEYLGYDPGCGTETTWRMIQGTREELLRQVVPAVGKGLHSTRTSRRYAACLPELSTYCVAFIAWRYYTLLTIDGHLDHFYLLAIMDSAVVDIYRQICVWTYISFFLSISRTIWFTFLRTCLTVFQSVCTIFYSCHQCMRVPFALHFC